MKEKKPVVLSGMRPTGKLHIGHLEGVLNEWVELQKSHECNFFVADYHAITTNQDTREIKQDTFDMVKDWVAYGIDPEKSNIFVQSMVPQHSNLHLIFSMLVNLGRLERLPTFNEYLKEIVQVDEKDVKRVDEEKRAKVSYGFLGYPILQAADILAYKTDVVPVGEDQLPHIEFTREIARKFNGLYGELFPLPEAKLGHAPRILGTDGRKMSKSYDNEISPLDDLGALQTKTKKMVSDSTRKSLSEPGHPYECSVFDLQEVYDLEGSKQVYSDCTTAKLGCGDCKGLLPQKIFEKYGEFREKRESLRDQDILEVLVEGSLKSQRITGETLSQVKELMLMDYIRK
ncbi:tryptophan--tRNA ligase [Candidatus Woesearchaeota archaeon]|nr:tryptophan--tRNA ligase [Candidatus Woesearchaeota archaeon]